MNNLYKKAFETYDLIVNWVIENHNDVVDDITQKNMNIDWAYRLLKGMVDEIGRLNERIEEEREYKEYFKSCYSSVTDENESLADEVDKLTDEVDKLKKALGDSYLIDTLNRLEITEKALDKASKYIDNIHSCPLDSEGVEVKGGCDSMCDVRTDCSYLCWKEWCMKGE